MQTSRLRWWWYRHKRNERNALKRRIDRIEYELDEHHRASTQISFWLEQIDDDLCSFEQRVRYLEQKQVTPLVSEVTQVNGNANFNESMERV